MLATSFGLTRPSSGQYLYKIKNAGAYLVRTVITRTGIFLVYIHVNTGLMMMA
jgi:hypothetical protein